MKINNINTRNMMVVREYKKAKIYRGLGVLGSAMNLMIGVNNARNQQLGNMFISYGCTCIMLKVANLSHKAVSALKPEYNSIVKRAKQIYKHK